MQEAQPLVIDIVTWNSLAYLPNLFASLQEQDAHDFTVTVVDNASNDGTVRWLTDTQPHVTVLRNFRNQGFSRAHNQAITLALSRWPEAEWPHRYVLVCNPDIEFAPDAIRRLVRALEADPSLAACGPKLLRAHIRGQEDGRMETERTQVIDSTGLEARKTRRFVDRGSGEEDRGQYDAATDVFGFSGACVLFRASALADAKLAGEFFDEDFFAYKEDIDLAWRMRRLGMRAAFVPGAVAWHHRRAPSIPAQGLIAAWKLRQKKSPLINELSTRNHLWLLWKNDEWSNVAFHAIWFLPREAAKALASLVSRSALRGNVQALVGFGKMWRKRCELVRRTRVNGAEMRRWFV